MSNMSVDWRKPARDLTDAELVTAFHETAAAFDKARSCEGHGGSPGEWAYERCDELEMEMRKRGVRVPVDNG